jgi:hypothetical protein
MLRSLFGPISSFKASPRVGRDSTGGSASARTLALVIGAGRSASAAASDETDRMLGVVSAEAVKFRHCYASSLDRSPSCETRNESIESARNVCGVEEIDPRKAIMKSATPEQQASIASLTKGVLEALRLPAEAAMDEHANRR